MNNLTLDEYERETIVKAFKLFVSWANECGIDYDSLGDLYEKYEQRLEDGDYEWEEGLMMIPIWEILGDNNE